MKINNLLESITAASSPENATNSAPKMGRSDKFLEDEQLEETTSSGSVASVSAPVGKMQRRGKGSIFSGIKTSEKFPNSRAVKEGFEDDNFTPADINRLATIRDLATIKAQAKELIKGKPMRRMKPEKIAYFYDKVDSLTSPMKVVKLMYDLLLAGEGLKTIGSANSTNPNAYQKRFTEDQINEVDPMNFDSDEDYYNAVKKQGQQQFSGDWDVYDEIASLENQIKYTKSSALAHTLYQKIDQLKQQAGIEDDEDEYEKEYDADIRARKGLEEAGFTDTIKRSVKRSVKNIKRGLQGWDKNLEGPGGEKLGDPKEIVRRNKSYSDDTTLQLAKRKELGFPFGGDSTTGEHTPRGLQRKVLDREIKRRGLSPEQGVAEEQVSEKSKSQAQFRTMAAVAHNPEFAKKVGISQKVGKEFHSADRKQDYKDLPKEVEEEKQRLDPKCWTGYKKQGTKMKGGVRVNNCVKVDEAEFTEDKLAQDLYKDLQIFKKGADKDIGSKAKDKEIGNKPKDKDIVAKEDWQKTNRNDKTDGMSPKAVKAYRRENPGSKLQTAVTKKPSELKAGSKDAKRRKSFCARMSGNPGPMKDENGKPTPKAKALKRWNC